MLIPGLFLAVLVGSGFIVLFKKLPVWLQDFISRRHLLFDIFVAYMAFSLLGYFILGIYAAGFIALFVSLYLWNFKKTHPKIKKPRKKIGVAIGAHLYNICR